MSELDLYPSFRMMISREDEDWGPCSHLFHQKKGWTCQVLTSGLHSAPVPDGCTHHRLRYNPLLHTCFTCKLSAAAQRFRRLTGLSSHAQVSAVNVCHSYCCKRHSKRVRQHAQPWVQLASRAYGRSNECILLGVSLCPHPAANSTQRQRKNQLKALLLGPR